MNVVSLFSREEHIVGIDISDTEVRLAVLEKDKKTGAAKIALLASEKVPSGTIEAGTVKKPEVLAETLKSLVRSAAEGRKRTRVTYAIVSVPADAAYAHVYGFPSTIKGERLEETMKLTVGFQLPFGTDQVYLDWEQSPDKTKNEVMLASMRRATVDGYLSALRDAGIHAVALELHPASIARAGDFSARTSLVVEDTAGSACAYIISDGIVRFVRALPKTLVSEEKMSEEIRKISDFAETENMKPEVAITLGSLSPKAPFSLYPNVKGEGGVWLIALGAAIRGLIPRREDTLISLMPVGTETAYAYQKALVFTSFITNITVGISIFFAIAFGAVWLFLVSLQQNAATQAEQAIAIPLPSGSAELEARAIALNALVGQTAPIVRTFPVWSPVLKEAIARVTTGILISNFSVSEPGAQISMVGTAKSRAALNDFRRSLENSPLFTAVVLPISNLEKRENIPFSVSFALKTPPYVQ